MAKRKFHEISDSTPSTATEFTAAERQQQQRLTSYLKNGQTQLLGALKLARGFERQKLGRREKDARGKTDGIGKGKELERIGAEIAVLKALDLNRAAEFYLARTLCKIKTIADSPMLPNDIRKIGDGGSPYRLPSEANVTARLFKTAAVKNTMDSIEEQVRSILEVYGPVKNATNKSSSRQAQSSKGKGWDGVSSNGESPGPELLEQHVGVHETSEASQDTRKDLEDIGDEDDYEAYSGRLANDSDSGLQQEQAKRASSMSITPELGDDAADDVSTATSSSPSPPPYNVESKTLQTQKRDTKTKPISRTTVLPSLAGGYFSGSEPEMSEVETPTGKSKKRNRMGQQARRAIAEERYGKTANHLKNGKGQTNKDAGWDMRRGAIDGHTKSRVRPRATKASQKPVKVRTKGESKQKPRMKDDSGPMHPSWIAKKKIKEQQSAGIGSFQGKKVVFD